MHKKYDNITFNFHQKNYIQKIIFIYFLKLKLPFFPVKCGTSYPVEMSGFVWPPNTFIRIFLTKTYTKFEFSVSRFFTCHVLVKFSPLFVEHGCSALGKDAGVSGVPASGRIGGRLNSRLED